MTARADFLTEFRNVAHHAGWTTGRSPANLVDDWDEFVNACEEGYRSTIYEFESERAVRDLLASVLDDASLQAFPEMATLRESVASIDRRFRALARPDIHFGRDDDPWWRRIVPRLTFGEFKEDLRSMYGFDSNSCS